MSAEAAPSFQDLRVGQAITRLRVGDIKLLSLDIFETLLHRRVPAPIDVFLRLGIKLQQADLLGPGIEPDSFAALRYQIEYEARNRRQRISGDREIRLPEIYETLPRQSCRLDVETLCKLEVETEKELAFAHTDLIALARWAKDSGIKLALISNMYMSEQNIHDILQFAAPDMPEVDHLFVSSDHRSGKRTGLMQKMLDHFGLEASQALHLGDNPVSDKLAAEEIGMSFVDFGSTDGFYAGLSREHPRQWHTRTDFFASQTGDAGYTALRDLIAHRALPSDLSSGDEGLYRYGQRYMGPLLTGFAAWVRERAHQEQATTIFGLLREGATLGRLVETLGASCKVKSLAASRLAVALAGFHPDYPEHLEDFLSRRGFWTLGTLMQQLGFTNDEARLLGNPDTTLQDLPSVDICERLLASPLAPLLFERSLSKRARLMTYLNGIGALDNEKLYLFDLGYAATIQRGLQRVFTIEKRPIVTHGFYLASAHVSRLTQLAGGVVEGFLAQNGNPNDFACAFCRSPEIVELACMPDHGSVTDYALDGTPLLAEDAWPDSQRKGIAALQRGLFDFAQSFAAQLERSKEPLSFTDPSWKKQMRALALRLVVYPTQDEAQSMGDWLADSDMGLASPRPIVSAGPHQNKLLNLTPQELAALPRRDVPWLYGVAAQRGDAYLKEVARIIMRQTI